MFRVSYLKCLRLEYGYLQAKMAREKLLFSHASIAWETETLFLNTFKHQQNLIVLIGIVMLELHFQSIILESPMLMRERGGCLDRVRMLVFPT